MLFLKIMLPIVFFVVGVIFASFGNMLMYRLANNKSVLGEKRSYCPKCGHTIAWYDNVPILSYLTLRGKCRHCHEPISIRYLLVELYGGFSFLLIYFLEMYLYSSNSPYFVLDTISLINSIIYAFSLLFLLISAYVDRIKKEIPYSMMIVLFVLACSSFVLNCVLNHKFQINQIIGFGVPVVFFLLIYFIGIVILKREPIGLGDIILFSILGLLLGWVDLILIIIFASTSCSIAEIIRIKKTGERREIPFVPYIYAGTLFTIVFSPLILKGIDSLVGGF